MKKIIIGLLLCAFAFVSVGCKKSEGGTSRIGWFWYHKNVKIGYFISEYDLEKYYDNDIDSSLYYPNSSVKRFDKKDVPLKYRQEREVKNVEIVYTEKEDRWVYTPDYKIKYIKEIK